MHRKKFKNEEIVIDDLSLISILDCRGTCDKAFSFLQESETQKAHPLLFAMNQYLYNPKLPLKTVDLIFAKFLIELSKVSNERFYAICATILRMLHECLTLYGYHFLIKLEQQNKSLGKILVEDEKQEVFCEKETAEYISILFDFFVKVFVKNYLKTQDFEIDFVIKFLKFFNSWLFKYHFSKIEIGFNSIN